MRLTKAVEMNDCVRTVTVVAVARGRVIAPVGETPDFLPKRDQPARHAQLLAG